MYFRVIMQPGKLGHRGFQDSVREPRIADVFLTPREAGLCAPPAVPLQVSAGYTHSLLLLSNGLV